MAARDNVVTRDALARACYRAGDFSCASAELGRLLHTGTRDPHLLKHAASILRRTNRASEADALLRLLPATALRHRAALHVHQ